MNPNGDRERVAYLQRFKDPEGIERMRTISINGSRPTFESPLINKAVKLLEKAVKDGEDLMVVRSLGDNYAENITGFDRYWDPTMSTEVNSTPKEEHRKNNVLHINQESMVPELKYSLSHVHISSSPCAHLLEEYRGFSFSLSPESHKSFHDAGFWYTTSIIAQRRILIDLPDPLYTNLYMALCAKSTIWKKSTGMRPIARILKGLRLSYLLHDGSETPEYFIQQAAGGIIPENYKDLPEEEKQEILGELATSGLGGLYIDELGQYLISTRNPNGTMALWRRILLEWECCPSKWTKATKGGGREIVKDSYLSIFGCIVPDNFREKDMEALLSDGTTARFLFASPETGGSSDVYTFRNGFKPTPVSLLKSFSEWHQRLIPPSVSIETEYKKEKPVYTISIDQPIVTQKIILSDEAWQAWDNYRRAIRTCIIENDLPSRTSAYYERCSTSFIKIAALAASIDDCPRIELIHMALAWHFIEQCRIGYHYFVEQAFNRIEGQKKQSTDNKILGYLQSHPRSSPREIRNALHIGQLDEVKKELAALEADGLVQQEQGRTVSSRLYFLVE